MMKNMLRGPRALLLLALMAAAAPAIAQAQTGGVGIGTTTPNASAVLDLNSTSKGLLPPRLSQSQRDAIAAPAAGLTVFNTTTGKLNTWNGTSWDAALSATEQPYQGPVQTFTGPGRYSYTVPAGVTRLTVDAAGAQGGTSGNNIGGTGARVQATLSVTPGEVLQAWVGGAGGYSNSPYSSGGFNGGGNGGYYGGSGGGATDVRRSGGGLANRLLVAAGGGGGSYLGAGSQGGAGGAPNGGDGTYQNGAGGRIIVSATGGTETAGGSPGGVVTGGLGTGGNGESYGGGGGGGYYGGGGGFNYGGGGGGSSWVTSTSIAVITFTAGVNAGNGSLTITPGPAYAAPVLDASNFTNVPVDNLGNHLATQNLDLSIYQLVGNGSNSGLSVGSTGNVGIGTGSPTQKLDVAGNAAVSGNATVDGNVGIGTSNPGQKLDVVATTNNLVPIATFQPQNLSQGVSLTFNGIVKTGTNAASNLTLDGKSTGNILLHTGGSAGSTGNVGIGLSVAPSQKLDVAGNVRVGTTGTVGKVLTNTTGNSNMLAVAYGASGNNGTTIFGGSGNFSVTIVGPGVYNIIFPAGSGLNGVNFGGVPVNVSLYGNPGFVTYTGDVGYITVRTYSTAGAPSSGYYFSFSAFVP